VRVTSRQLAALIVAAFIQAAASAQSAPAAPPKKPASTKPVAGQATKPAPTGKAQSNAVQPAADAPKPQLTAKDYLEQGKQLSRAQKLRPALAKFNEALKLEPESDEALGLAANANFKLGNLPAAREQFLRRAELPNQKDSVKAYCYYNAGLADWREAQELIAKNGEMGKERVVFKLSEKESTSAAEDIKNGLGRVDRVLQLMPSYADAHNLKNLLHAVAAQAAADEAAAEAERRASVESLRQALKLYHPVAGREAAEFGSPTVRVAEFATTPKEQEALVDPMMKLLEGGQPVTRAAAVFPAIRPPKNSTDSSDPSATGVTAQGGAYSLGGGRGALSAAYVAGKVKVEVLVSTAGNVVFAHVVGGRADLNGAALAAARKWKFTPAKFEGQPVQVNGVITFALKPPAAKPPAPPEGKKN